MTDSSDTEVEFGEIYKNLDIDSYKNFFNYLSNSNSYIKKQNLFKFITDKGIQITDNRIKSDLDLLIFTEDDLPINKYNFFQKF